MIVKVKKNLTSLLDINSLERHYILYYIFKKRGAFYDGESNINTYAYYNFVANKWRNIYFADGNLTLKINLDENSESINKKDVKVEKIKMNKSKKSNNKFSLTIEL